MADIKGIWSAIRHFIGYTIVFAFCLLLIIGGIGQLLGPPVAPKDIATTKVTGTLAAAPEVNSFGKHRYIRLLLNEYPNSSFNIDDDAYYATKSKMVNDYLSKGDTISLDVAADDYKDKLDPNGAEFNETSHFKGIRV